MGDNGGGARIFNGTPHDICIIKGAYYDRVEGAHRGGEVALTIPSSAPLYAELARDDAPPIDGVPMSARRVLHIDPLPTGYDAYVVSSVYYAAFRSLYPGHSYTNRLYICHGQVHDEFGGVRGCTGLIRPL